MLAVRVLARRRTSPAAIGRAAAVPFLAFVLALGIVVAAVTGNGLAAALARLVPAGTSLPALAATAAPAAALANVINNLPAVLVLLPLAAPAGPAAVLAVLLGVNIGPNDLRRLPGHAVVAAGAARARHRARAGGVRPARAAHRPPRPPPLSTVAAAAPPACTFGTSPARRGTAR